VGAHIENRGKLGGRVFGVKEDSRLRKDRLQLLAGGQDPSAAVQDYAPLGHNFCDGLLLPGTLRRIVIIFEILEIKAPCGKRQENGYQKTKQNNRNTNVFHLIFS